MNNTLLLDLIFSISLVYESIFLKNICQSVIIHFEVRFPRSIVRCCVWYIYYYRTKIIIYYHRVRSFSKPKSLSNVILNVYNMIRSEYDSKVMQFQYKLFQGMFQFTIIVNNTSIMSTLGLLLGSIFFVHFYLCHIFIVLT